jgi:hypothetical protein
LCNAREKAVAVLRRFDSPCYGLGFKRGTQCASLVRSLAVAGGKTEDCGAPLSEHDRKQG